LQDILVAAEDLQDLLFDIEEHLFVGSAFEDESLLLFLQIWAFLLHEDTQQLVIQALVGDHEVDQGHLR